jgi:hypothetical protein
MLLLLGSLWTLASTLLIRLVLSLCKVKGYALRTRSQGNTIIVGQPEETSRIARLYAEFGMKADLLVETNDCTPQHLQDLIRIERAEAVVFCGRDIDLRAIIDLMAHLRTTGVDYKIAPSEGDYIIGSDSVVSREELFLADLDTISTDTCRRNKRLFDILSSLLLLLLSPITFWFQRHKRSYFPHTLSVLVGRCSWVGYTGRKGIFTPSDLFDNPSPTVQERLMLRYMRHYRTTSDIVILFHNWRNI